MTFKTVSISDCLSSKNIRFFENPCTRESVLDELIKMLPFEDPVAISAALQEREERGSTVISAGIAFPHARMAGLAGIVAALGICPEGVSKPLLSKGLFAYFSSSLVRPKIRELTCDF